MVVNSCSAAKEIDEKFGLKTYNENYNCVKNDTEAFKQVASEISIKSKIMSQEAGDPEEYI